MNQSQWRKFTCPYPLNFFNKKNEYQCPYDFMCSPIPLDLLTASDLSSNIINISSIYQPSFSREISYPTILSSCTSETTDVHSRTNWQDTI